MTTATNVATALGLGDGAVRELRPGELVLESRASQLPALADLVVQHLGGRLLTLFGTDDRLTTGQFFLHHVWSLSAPRAFLRISGSVDPGCPSFPSIAALHPVANWFEREVMDFFGLIPEGHPNPQRVALHADWPEGAWALRKDFPSDGTVPRVTGDFHPFRPVTGEGVFEVPAMSGSAWPASRSYTCNFDCSMYTKVQRSASSNFHGSTACSSQSPSPGIRP